MTTARNTIAGHSLVLTAGRRYRATRQDRVCPQSVLWLDKGFIVEIEDCADSIIEAWVAFVSLPEASAFIVAFMDGESREIGRLWL